MIPEIKVPSIKDYKILNIDEKFKNLHDLGFLCAAQYYKQGIPGAPKYCFARESVAKMLQEARKELPEGYDFLIFDGWRPICVQQRLWNYYKQSFKNQHPELSDEELDFKTSFYVSKPSFDILKPTLHNTGGAIDLTIIDKNGKKLNMGTEFDEFGDKTWTNHFEKYSEDEEIRDNRRLLYDVMTKNGFVNLPSEWWHFEYGSKFWAYFNNTDALYTGQLQLPFDYEEFPLH